MRNKCDGVTNVLVTLSAFNNIVLIWKRWLITQKNGGWGMGGHSEKNWCSVIRILKMATLTFHFHVSLFKLNIRFAKTRTPFSNNMNTTININQELSLEKSLRLFIYSEMPNFGELNSCRHINFQPVKDTSTPTSASIQCVEDPSQNN